MNWATIWPELWRQSPLAAVMALALLTGWHGDWVFGATYKGLQDSIAHECDELRSERDLYRGIALKGIAGDEQLAKASIQNIEQAVPAKPGQKPKPAAVIVKTQPVLPSEKAAVEKPPEAIDPKTLAERQKTAQTVLTKVAPAGAQVQAMKKN